MILLDHCIYCTWCMHGERLKTNQIVPTFEVSKLNLVLLWLEDLFCERAVTCHRRCYIVLRHEGKTTVIVWSYTGCFSPSHLSYFLSVTRGVEDNQFWGPCCVFWKKTENFPQPAVYFPSNKVSDSGALQESSRVYGATRLAKPKTQNLVLGRAKNKTVLLQYTYVAMLC